MRVSPFISRSAPAPENLKRLYLSLLALTLTIGTISLITLLMIGGDLRELAGPPDPASAWIDEMTARLGQAQISFHRSINSPGRDGWPSGDLQSLEALSEKYQNSGEPAFHEEVKQGIYRLRRLSQLAAGALERGSWVDLQIIVKDADRSSEEIFSLLQGERTRLQESRSREERNISRVLRFAAVLLGLSLIASGFIAVAYYFNWKRFERKVLGIG